MLTTLTTAALSSVMHAQAGASPAEQALLQLTNRTRVAHNLPPLHWDSDLANAARAHAQRVVREHGELLHQYSGEPDLTARGAQSGAHFTTIAENIGSGPDPVQIHQTWMSTPSHRSNILDPNLNAAGIAVVADQGLLYAVEDLSHSVAIQSFDSLEKQVAQTLQAHGIAPAASNADARQTCSMPSGAAGTPKLVVQWDGPDPTLLPDALLRAIATGGYTSAQVGVCATKQPNPQFTTYNVAVLLY
ncbi:CAP domain-containing protein [Granulicella sp. S190]|uniref:CAP domain-containing protein n=1 Tax=Granulicella sp. S190 TaxID=1747226 RepID=UPI00131B87EA|nr:CAP domain-containing protein [Granulicella sp. S190]